MINSLRKERFPYYHKKLWDGIIEELKNKQVRSDAGIIGSKIKEEVYDRLFAIRVESYCFGCEMAKLSNKNQNGELCNWCPFDIDIEIYNGCLNRNWYAYTCECRRSRWSKAIEYAILIRDFPWKEKKNAQDK